MPAATAKRKTPQKEASQSRKAKDAAALRKATQIKPAAAKNQDAHFAALNGATIKQWSNK